MNEQVVNLTDEQAKEVNELFMNENDQKALELLYDYTNDKLIKIVLIWDKEYNAEIFSGCNTNELQMYDDIINYLYEKYILDRE